MSRGPLDPLSNILQRLADLERRSNNFARPGKVKEVDAEKGTIVLTYGKNEDGEDVDSPPIPWTEQAGFIKTWSPPTVGEQMIMISPSGELGSHSWAMKGGFSDENKQPHDKGNEFVLDMGDGTYRLHIDGSGNVTETSKGSKTVKYDGPEKREFATMENKAGRIDFNKSGGGTTGVSTA